MDFYKSEIAFLVQYLDDSEIKAELKNLLNHSNDENDKIKIYVNELNLSSLQDKILDILTYHGIDVNGEINTVGLYAESLIDKINSYLNN